MAFMPMPHCKKGGSQISKKSIIELIALQTAKNKAFRKKMNTSGKQIFFASDGIFRALPPSIAA